MKRRLIGLLAIVTILLPLGAGVIVTSAVTTDPTAPGVPPTVLATSGAGVDRTPGVPATPLAPVGTVDTRAGVPATAIGTPLVLPTPTPTATGIRTATPTGTAVSTATPTGTATSSATPTGTASTTPSPCTTATATGTATASATPCATATATAVPPTTACTASGPTTAIVPASVQQGEVAGLRTRTSRTYALGKGKYQQVISTGAINYQDAQGKWQLIDDTLVPATTTGYAYQNKANAFTIALPSDLANNPVKVTSGGNVVSFSLVGAQGSGTPCGATQTYANALPGVNLAYAAAGDGVEETLTLATASAPSAYVFNLQTSAGLTAKANSHGGIDFVDGAGKTQSAFLAPVMHDSATPKRAESTAVTLQLATTASGTTVILTADTAWLHDSARVYPVVIDPTYIDYAVSATQDCKIASDQSGNLCSGSYNENYIGWVSSGAGHSLLQFDLSSFNTNGQVINAEVQMALAEYGPPGGSSSFNIRARRVTTPWLQSSVTWSFPWQHTGGDFANKESTTVVIPNQSTGDCASNVCHFSTTLMTQGWISGSVLNYGVLFEGDGDPSHPVNAYAAFYSSRYSNVNFRPKLVIVFQEPQTGGGPTNDLGKRPFYTLANAGIDDRTSVGVNIVSGNLVVTAHDLAIAGTGMDLSIDRYYNSLTLTKGAFGSHWAMGTGADLFLSTFPNTNDVVLQGNTGYLTTFMYGSGAYTTPPGMDADLVKNPDGTYTLTAHKSSLRQRFNGSGQLTSIVDQNGNTITYTYNTDGTLQKITDTQTREVDFTYGVAGKKYITQIAENIPNWTNRTWTYHYTGDNLDSSTDANGKTTYYFYDSDGNLNRIQDPNGNNTAFAYANGAFSALASITRTGTNLPTGGLVAQFAYPTVNSDGSGTTIYTDPNGHTTTVVYNTNRLVTDSTDALGHHYGYAYNADFHITTITDALTGPGSHTTTYTYGIPGDNERLTQVTLPTGAVTKTQYTDTNHKYYPTIVTDAQGNTATTVYDTYGNKHTVTYSGLPVQHNTVTYTYNSPSQHNTLNNVQDLNGNTTSFGYDTNFFNLTTIIPPYGGVLQQVHLVPDPVSRKQQVTDGKGQVATYTYDPLDRTKSVNFLHDGTAILNTYDNNGNLTQRVDAAGTATIAFDGANRMLTKATSWNSVTITYAYDNASNLTSITDPGGQVSYGYDAANRLSTLTEPGGAQTSFGYDEDNDHLTTIYPNGVRMTLTYDNSQRLTGISGTMGTNALTSFSYTYTNPNPPAGTPSDSALRFTMSENDALGVNTTNYTYDTLNRLTSAVATGNAPSSYQYGYDPNGNRTSTTIGGVGTTALFGPDNEQQNWNLGPTTPRTYTYDGNGSETGSSAGEARLYNAQDQTTSITGLFGASLSLGYEGGGQTERISAGGSTYINNSLGIGRETNALGTLYYTRTPGGHLVSQRYPNGASYYYLFDGLGSVVALTDSTGAVAARYGYDPYGQQVVKKGLDSNSSATGIADGNPFRYTGAYLDTTGLYKMGARYYDPARGRFTQLDPKGGGYVYASDNPVNRVDPSGLDDVGGNGVPSGFVGRTFLQPTPGSNMFAVNVTIYQNRGYLTGPAIITVFGYQYAFGIIPYPYFGEYTIELGQNFLGEYAGAGSLTLPNGSYDISVAVPVLTSNGPTILLPVGGNLHINLPYNPDG